MSSASVQGLERDLLLFCSGPQPLGYRVPDNSGAAARNGEQKVHDLPLPNLGQGGLKSKAVPPTRWPLPLRKSAADAKAAD